MSLKSLRTKHAKQSLDDFQELKIKILVFKIEMMGEKVRIPTLNSENW